MAPTIDDLIRSCEQDIEAANDRIDSAKAEASSILDSARTENREYLTRAEEARSSALFADIDKHKASAKRSQARLNRARETASEEAEYDRKSRDVRPASPGRRYTAERGTATLSVTRNERVYRPDNDPHGQQFLMDVARGALFSDIQSNERLARHIQEERVERPGMYQERAAGDLATTGLGALVVPQYLTDLYAPAVGNMRPLANNFTPHTLGDQGMSILLAKISTATSAAVQATQLTTVSSTSAVETDLTVAVQTAAGSQNVSRQAIERGTGIDQVVGQDLVKRVATVLDSTLINQATTGITAAAQTITYTSASPTQTEFWPYIYQAQSKLEQTLLGQARVDTVVMHPRRFNWLVSGVASTWPVLGQLNAGVPPQQMAMQVTNEYGSNVRAVLANGLRVVVDANVPTNLGAGTNQDEVYVCASEELHIWEPPLAPVMIRCEQPNAAMLGVLLVCYQYFAATVQRYASNPAKISGTGLIAPAGF